MRSPFLVSCATALIVAAVPGCGNASLSGAAASPGAQRSQTAGELATSAASPSRRPNQLVAPCQVDGLGTRFQGGGYGGGNDFASIYIWNPGPVPCQLAGAVTFTALFARGTTDRNARPNTPQHLSITLPARMLRPGEGADTARYLVAYLMGAERDDPAQPNGVCRRQDELTPAALELSIGRITLRIRNQDQASRQSTAVYGCHGQVLLEGFSSPPGQ